MRLAIRTAALLACMLAAGCCYYSPRVAVNRTGRETGEPLVRVRLTVAGRVPVSCKAGLVVAGRGPRWTISGREEVELGADGVSMSGRVFRTLDDTVRFSSAADGFISVGARTYRGEVIAFQDSAGGLAVVNVLRIEEYLYGVVPCEIGPINTETMEAVKAQAVAARSFTMSRLGRRKGLGHDLFDSFSRDQEYQGTGREAEPGREAVDATRGQALVYHGVAAEALYHANCGGVTSNGSQPYLRSVVDAPGRGRKAYCADKPNFMWSVTVSKESLNAVVSRCAGGARRARSVRLDADRKSGRVKYLRFATDRGEVRMHGMDFRSGMGLRSQNFTMSIRGGSVTISGRGWGHGSGMCQDGAVGMALSGSDFRQILRHYYTGVGLVRLY